MIIVPVLGDEITMARNLPVKVLSFSNLNPNGPSIIADSGLNADIQTVMFEDITEVNGVPVSYIKNVDGFKVLKTDGFIKRLFDLPQPGDSIVAKTDSGSAEYEVKRLSLHVPDKLSYGLVLDVFQPGSENLIEQITLNQITDIDVPLFNRTKFGTYYSEYMSKV